jgi:hypothetical protein
MEINIHQLKFEEREGDEFARRFNIVSDLYSKATKENTAKAWQDFYDAKLSLEMGLPM